MPADLVKARSKAAGLLLSSRLYGLKTDVVRLNYDKNIIFNSYSNFCKHSIAKLTELEGCPSLRDGCAVKREKDGSVVYLVLFNDNVKSLKRRKFTLAHEVGHILLEHKRDNAVEEAEANCFAAELIIPRILVWELQRLSNFKITARETAEIFGVSTIASQNQISSLARDHAFLDCEIQLLNKLSGFLPDFSGPIIDV